MLQPMLNSSMLTSLQAVKSSISISSITLKQVFGLDLFPKAELAGSVEVLGGVGGCGPGEGAGQPLVQGGFPPDHSQRFPLTRRGDAPPWFVQLAPDEQGARLLPGGCQVTQLVHQCTLLSGVQQDILDDFCLGNFLFL